MSTPSLQLHRAYVHEADYTTGYCKVRIPGLLSHRGVIEIPPVGLTFDGTRWNTPEVGSYRFVAVTPEFDQYYWVVSAELPYPPVETYQVGGGTTGTQPTFNGDPLFTAQYVRNGDLVHFEVQVDFDNITNFGTGQYFVTLPFPSAQGIMFRSGCLHDADTGREYHISGHTNAGSDQVFLFTTDITGQSVFDYPFDHDEPITLTTADNFHISGDYIAEPL